jgi:hypothetical protein
MRHITLMISLMSCILLSYHAQAAKESKLSLSTGYTYGDQEDDLGLETDVDIIPLSLSYKTDSWNVRISTAYLRITGPDDVFIEGYEDGTIDVFVETLDERKGWGDTFLSLYYSPAMLRGKNYKLSLGYKFKAPTGDKEQGLSSGEVDHHGIARGYYRINRIMLLGRLGYQLVGDTDERDYNNRLYAGAGLVYIASRYYSIGAQYYAKQASTDERDPIRTAGIMLQIRPIKNWSASISFTKGLTDATLDQQIGFQIRHRF